MSAGVLWVMLHSLSSLLDLKGNQLLILKYICIANVLKLYQNSFVFWKRLSHTLAGLHSLNRYRSEDSDAGNEIINFT